MDDWLKNNPTIAWIIQLMTAIFLIFITSWVQAGANDEQSVKDAIKAKADKIYVDTQDAALNEKISGKADKSLVESMDSKIDLIIELVTPNK